MTALTREPGTAPRGTAAAVTETDLLRGYAPHPDLYRLVIEDRIRTLWTWHRWFQAHVGWIHESEQENRAELHSLLRLARTARRLAQTVPDPLTAGKAYTDAGWTESELREAFGR